MSCLILLTSCSTQAQIKEYRVNYVNRYKDIAISEMERSGVPASIKLAQGLLESDAGRSVLARRANNHFGMKCGSQWDGKTFYREDDDYDEFGNLMKSCFRVYRNAEASFVAHSEFLTDPRKEYRYGFLFRLDPKDYNEWAHGLKSAGYATNPNYPRLLIGLIETYQLDQYDSGGFLDEPIADLGEDENSSLLGTSGIFLINDVKTILAEVNDSPDKIANRTGIAVSRILKYNEKIDTKAEKINEGTKVFLQRKRIFFRGRQKWHNVEDGETMFDISQKYGLRLDRLYRKNRMEAGTEPATGERIKLRWRVKKDQVPRLRNDIKPELPNATGDGEELEMDDTTPFQPDDDIPSNIDTGNNPPYEAPPVNDPYPNNGSIDPNTNTPITNEPYDGANNETNDNTNTNTGGGFSIEPVTTTPPNTNTNTGNETNTGNNTNTSTPPNVVTIPDVTDVQTDAPENAEFHKVERGDTLYRIAQKYGITVDDIRRMNNLNSDLIRSGWLLRIK